MAKKDTAKETKRTAGEETVSLPGKVMLLLKNETMHFMLGLLLVIFAVYLLLAFTSFFFTGAADQSIVDGATASELASTHNGIRNYAGSRGAQLASYLINGCFGVASYLIALFLVMAGLKLMRVRKVRLWKWFIGCTLSLVWFSVFFGFAFKAGYEDSFIYLGGLHGYNVGNWLASQIGAPGVWLLLLVTALCFLVYASARTIVWLRKLFSLSFLKREKKSGDEQSQGEVPEEFDDSWTSPAVREKEKEKKEKKKPSEEVSDQETGGTKKDTQEADAAEVEEVDAPLSDEVEEAAEEESEGGRGIILTLDDEEWLKEKKKRTEDGEVVMTIETGNGGDAVSGEDAGNVGNGGGTKDGRETSSDDTAFTVESNETEEYRGPEKEPYNPRLDLENYHFPTLDLMKHYDNDAPDINMEEQNANKDKIVSTLRSFGIEINTIKATVGPTVTLYEITLAQGVRISKIKSLEDDIALHLAALDRKSVV